MKRMPLPFIVLIVFSLLACNLSLPASSTPTAVPLETIIPATAEPTRGLPPKGPPPTRVAVGTAVRPTPPAGNENAITAATPQPGKPIFRAGDLPGVYWVTNPASGVEWFTQIILPKKASAAGPLPALVLVPGGIGSGTSLMDPIRPLQIMADAGFVIVVFDAEGRAKTAGVENTNGFIQQDGLTEVIRFTATLPEVDATQIGLVSFSYGITMASGALARHPELPVRMLIDWEGPSSRFYSTVGCNIPAGGSSGGGGKIAWQPCDNEGFWSEREAATFIKSVCVPYQRIQSEKDHVQSTNAHAVEMINNAVAGSVPWVRLNDETPNQTYDPAAPPAMLPESSDRQREENIVRYAQEILALNIAPICAP